ncbi:hypothetical protein KIN20_021462 [Parelaphostrongylus tenuis]|uniref:IFT121-like TPR repeats domain-containing protein n=1 Tax=Parelaphostrongylus tenuis TaxID=148309 RepID=A0AAD5QU74_PARTN|nr:hypothetical protein KIN20_021462 [Parelaphostrongylus tenuis]
MDAQAVALSRTHNLRDVNVLMGKYVEELSESSERSLAAVQLYRRAGRFLDGARVTSIALNELLEGDKNLSLEDSRMIEQNMDCSVSVSFHDARSTQLFAGDHSGAMKTSLYLTHFEAYIDPIEIHSLLALSSCACRQFTVCSRAFMSLESLTDPASEERRAYQKLALDLFTRYPPMDSYANMVNRITCDKPVPDYEFCCPHCETKFPVCIASGRPMTAYHLALPYLQAESL